MYVELKKKAEMKELSNNNMISAAAFFSFEEFRSFHKTIDSSTTYHL